MKGTEEVLIGIMSSVFQPWGQFNETYSRVNLQNFLPMISTFVHETTFHLRIRNITNKMTIKSP